MKNLSILLLLFSALAFAQEEPSKWRFGGGLGINAGNNSFFGFTVSPAVGYLATNNLEVGAQAGYSYSSSDFFKQNLFNIGPYANYYIGSFFGRGEYAYYTGNASFDAGGDLDINESALWLGGGFSQSIGGRARLNFGVLYNVLYDEDDSIFGSAFQPFGGVSIGF